jgi:TatD DNase family protein
MPELYDTHAHLDFPDFSDDLPDVIERALAAGITRILTIGTSLEGSRRSIALAERFPAVYAVAGVHPNHACEEREDIRSELAKLVTHPRVVAVGETGLDYHRIGDRSPLEVESLKARQRSTFRQQLAVAADHDLNCVIHQRETFDETLAILAEFQGRVRGVFHCFTGTPHQAAMVLEEGSLVSFTGVATFKNAQNVRDTLAAVPLGRFMLETDCPFLAPLPHRGRRCEPAFVRDLATVVEVVKGCSADELSAATCLAARTFFARLR